MDELVECRDCLSRIPGGASRCRECGAAQVRWWETNGFRVAAGLVLVLVAALALRTDVVSSALFG